MAERKYLIEIKKRLRQEVVKPVLGIAFFILIDKKNAIASI